MQMLKTANFFDVYYVQVRQEQKIYIYIKTKKREVLATCVQVQLLWCGSGWRG